MHTHPMQHWQEIPVEGVRPEKRSSHAAVCLGIDGNHPQLLVLQGRSETYKAINDVWMLDLKSWVWKEVCGKKYVVFVGLGRGGMHLHANIKL